MDATAALRRGSRFLAVFGVLGASSLFVLGCDEPAAQAEPKDAALPSPTKAPAVAEPGPSQGSERAGGKPSYKEEAFSLSLEAPPAVSSGKEAAFKVILTAAGGYKVNDEYPLKFQFAETANVRPKKSTVRKEDAVLEKQRAELPLPVTIESPGKHKVSGTLSFSVCTDERCLIEKRDLSVEVDAS